MKLVRCLKQLLIISKAFRLLALSLLAMAMAAASASADTLQIGCIGNTNCFGGSQVTALSSNASVAITLKDIGNSALTGEAFVAVLIPNATASENVRVGSGPGLLPTKVSLGFNSGNLGGALGLKGLSGNTFTQLASASAQAGVSATSFSVYEYNLGAFNSGGKGTSGLGAISIGSLPAGSIIVGFVTSATNFANILGITTLRRSLSVTPEADSLLLFGLGILALAFIARRRLLPEDSCAPSNT